MIKSMNKKPRGGKREGAGRPALAQPETKMVSIRLPVSLVNKLKAVGNRTAFIVAALTEALEK
jgi:hypothetical protein